MSTKSSKVNERLGAQSYDRRLIDVQYEYINGIRYEMSPSPTVDHQLLVTQIWSAISQTCDSNGLVVVAPIDVHLEDNIAQPDLVFISNNNSHIIKNQKIIGAPDLLIEVLSKSTGTKDKTIKRDLYEKHGVAEYWIVDPAHYIIDQFMLSEGKYGAYKSYGIGDTLKSPKLSCISIDLEKLFEIIIKRKSEDEINEIRASYKK